VYKLKDEIALKQTFIRDNECMWPFHVCVRVCACVCVCVCVCECDVCTCAWAACAVC
jgi:hypothetical protein